MRGILFFSQVVKLFQLKTSLSGVDRLGGRAAAVAPCVPKNSNVITQECVNFLLMKPDSLIGFTSKRDRPSLDFPFTTGFTTPFVLACFCFVIFVGPPTVAT